MELCWNNKQSHVYVYVCVYTHTRARALTQI